MNSLAILAFLAAASPGSAAVPQTLHYQGVLKESGIPVSGSRAMTFRLTSSDGSAQYFTSGATAVTVSTGLFRVTLSLPSTVDWGAVIPYFEVTVGTVTLLPREAVVSSLYALHASTAERVAAGAISDAQVAAGAAIAASKISGTAMTLAQAETVGGVKTFNADLLMGSGALGAAPGAAGVTVSTNLFLPSTRLGLGTSSPVGPLHVRASGQNALVVDPNSAFVGLGTTAPSERLEIVNGSIKLTGVGASIIFQDGSVMTSAGVGSAASLVNAADANIQSDSNGDFSGDVVVKTAASERLRVTNNGNFGVGTAVPQSKLHIGFATARDLAFNANAAGAWMVGLPTGGNSSTTNDQTVSVYAAGNGAAGGGVVSNPSVAVGAALTLSGNDAAGTGSAVLDASGASGAVRLKTSGTERLRVTPTGSVGVGTTQPGSLLHVSGGDLQVGDATASTVSASGHITLPAIAAPAAKAGRLYFETGSGKLRYSPDGAGFVDVATGALTASDPTKVAKAGDGMSGPLTMSASTLTVNGQDASGYSLKLASGITAAGGTVSAGLFVGNGAGLTGIVASSVAAAAVGDVQVAGGISQSKVTNLTTDLSAKLAKAGDTMTGQLTLAGSTLTVTGQDASGYSLKLASGITAAGGTVAAGLFVGNGAGLTGIVASSIAAAAVGDVQVAAGISQSKVTNLTTDLSAKLAKAGDTMTGQLTLAGSTLTVTGQDASGYSLKLASGITASGGTVAAGLFVGSGAGLTNIPSAGQVAASGVQAGTLGAAVIASSVAAGAVGDVQVAGGISQSKVTNLTTDLSAKLAKAGDTMTGQLTLAGSTLTVTGDAFSVGGTTFAIASGRVGIGTTDPAARLHVAGGDVQVGGATASTFSAAGHITLPAIAQPAAAAGRIYFDSSLSQLRLGKDGAAFTAVGAASTRTVAFSLMDPLGLVATDDVPSFYRASAALQITSVWCESDDGTATINLQRDDGSPADVLAANLACGAGGSATGSFAAGEAALAAGQNLDFVLVSLTASKRVNVMVSVTEP